jgi:cbb3-type cytochrome oxidase subunit 3
MGRNEIRLRRQRMAAGNIARHRNYGELMERHARDQKWKRMFKIFIYFLLVAFLTIIFIIVLRWEKRKEKKQSSYEYAIPFSSPRELS